MKQKIVFIPFMSLMMIFSSQTMATSYDDSGQPPGAPGTGSTTPPLTTNKLPATGVTPVQSGIPQKEVQPGEETPQVDTSTMGGTVSGIRRPRGTARDTGDDDDIDDQEVQRHTVQGVDTLGKPGKMGGRISSSGGDGTQTEDELYVGRKAGDTSSGNPGVTPSSTPPVANSRLSKPSGKLTTQPSITSTEKGPGAIVIPRTNCGTYHTGWVNDPNADVNPCPASCERGERLSLDEQKSGDTTKYDGMYRCYLPELVVNQKPEIARQIEAGGIKGTNCGTFWTDRKENLDMEINPCPANCERGELLNVRRDSSYDGSQALYAMMYRCYQSGTLNLPTVSNPKAMKEDLKIKSTPPTSATGAMSSGSSDSTSVSPVSGAPKGVQEAGTETASTSSGIDAAPGMTRMKSPPAATASGISPNTTLKRQGPTITTIADITSTSLTMKWKPMAKAIGYTMHATATGINHSIESSEIKQPANLPAEMSATLSGLAPEIEYKISVSANIPSSMPLHSEQKPITTLAGINPQGFKASSIGPGALRLEWQPVTGASAYAIQGDNLPRTQTANTAVSVTNLSPGTHQWSVVTIYPADLFNDINPTKVSASIDAQGNINTGERGHYRISILGFRVNQQTDDDPLQRDGKGDEVYVAAAVGKYDMGSHKLVQRYPVLPSPVFGDKNGFENNDKRVLAGGASAGGGLQSGNVYPSPDPINSGKTVTTIDLPYLVWEGDLTANDALIVTPAVWEWDNNSSTYYDHWLNGDHSDYHHETSILPDLNDGEIVNALTANRVTPVFRKNLAVGFKKIPSGIAGHFEGPGGDRVIGNDECGELDTFAFLMCYNQPWIPLTKQLIDKELASGGSGVLPAGVLSLDLVDHSISVSLPGSYTLYLKVERLP